MLFQLMRRVHYLETRKHAGCPLFSLLFLSICLPLVAQQAVSPVAFSESTTVVPAASPSGPASFQAVYLKVDFTFGPSKKESRDLSIVYDPLTKYYSWQIAAFPSTAGKSDFNDAVSTHQKIFYADADGLVEFSFKSELWIKLHKSRADDIDAARDQALKEIRQGLASIERYTPRTGPSSQKWPWDYQLVDLKSAITPDFNCFPRRANCPDDLTRIVSVERQGNSWRLVLSNRWDEEIILDSRFALVSGRRLPLQQ